MGGRPVLAGYDGGPITADRVDVDTAAFVNILTAADDDVQKALETIDAFGGTIATTYLKLDASNDPLTGDLTLNNTTTALILQSDIDFGDFEVRAETFESDIVTGDPPLVVASTTKVLNLNVEQVDGFDFDQSLLIADSPTFDNITLSGASILANAAASGVLTLGGTGGSNNENLLLDFETSSNNIIISSTTNTLRTSWLLDIKLQNDIGLILGSSFNTRLHLETEGNDNLQLGLNVGSATNSGYFSIMKQSDMGNANRSPLAISANPVLRIYSSDVTNALDYGDFYHDQANFWISIGDGALNLSSTELTSFIFNRGATPFLSFTATVTWNQFSANVYDDYGNCIILTNSANQVIDHGHGLQTDPTFFFQSDDSPAVSNNRWGSEHHDGDNFHVQTGVFTGAGSSPATITNDVHFFDEDIDVGDGEDGKKLSVFRKADEGDNSFSIYINNIQRCQLVTDALRLQIESSAGIMHLQDSAAGDILLFGGSGVGENRKLIHYGWITAAATRKIISWQLSDITDNFELTREDANILNFDIQMPLITDTITAQDPGTGETLFLTSPDGSQFGLIAGTSGQGATHGGLVQIRGNNITNISLSGRANVNSFINTPGSNVGIGTADPTTDFSVKEKFGVSPIGGLMIMLTNETGSNTIAGQLVKADTATDDAVILAGIGDIECFGVFLDSGIADGSEAWVVFSGLADVAFDDDVAAVRGNWVGTGVAAGYARNQASPPAAPDHFEELGHCIESVSAGGGGTHILARCVLHFN